MEVRVFSTAPDRLHRLAGPAYELQPDGSLKGLWTIADKPGAGTETLTPAH